MEPKLAVDRTLEILNSLSKEEQVSFSSYMA